MISSLLVLNSSYVGSHDLWWADDPLATKGYNVYRAFDYPANWAKLTTVPVGGHFYRDMSTLQEVTYTVQDADWVERGELGRWAFRIPEVPFTIAEAGRVMPTHDPSDVTVIASASGTPALDGVALRPAKVDGFDRTVWLRMDNTLPEGGAVSALPLVNNGVVWQGDYSGIKAFQVVFHKLLNYVDIYTALNRTYYTVVPVGDSGELHLPGAPHTQVKNTQEIEAISWEFEEMVRRNGWLFEQVAEPAYLMFRKWRGQLCGCTYGNQQAKSGCRTCFETGIVGGYIGPYDFPFVPPDSALSMELNEGGIKTTRDSRSFIGPTPIVQNGDLVIRRNGDRMVVSNVVYKQPRGVILQQDFTVSLLSPGDTRYLIPVVNTGLPTIFNPVVRPDPLDGKGGGEPVFDPRTVPGKDWENPNIPIGRTVTFGKLQT